MRLSLRCGLASCVVRGAGWHRPAAEADACRPHRAWRPGRNLARADLVTEMRMVRHPFRSRAYARSPASSSEHERSARPADRPAVRRAAGAVASRGLDRPLSGLGGSGAAALPPGAVCGGRGVLAARGGRFSRNGGLERTAGCPLWLGPRLAPAAEAAVCAAAADRRIRGGRGGFVRRVADGRTQLSRIVSRDTSQLSAAEVRESALELLAENLRISSSRRCSGSPCWDCPGRRYTASPIPPMPSGVIVADGNGPEMGGAGRRFFQFRPGPADRAGLVHRSATTDRTQSVGPEARRRPRRIPAGRWRRWHSRSVCGWGRRMCTLLNPAGCRPGPATFSAARHAAVAGWTFGLLLGARPGAGVAMDDLAPCMAAPTPARSHAGIFPPTPMRLARARRFAGGARGRSHPLSRPALHEPACGAGRHHGIAPGRIVVGAGASELILRLSVMPPGRC